jgi:hypothetical protein
MGIGDAAGDELLDEFNVGATEALQSRLIEGNPRRFVRLHMCTWPEEPPAVTHGAHETSLGRLAASIMWPESELVAAALRMGPSYDEHDLWCGNSRTLTPSASTVTAP